MKPIRILLALAIASCIGIVAANLAVIKRVSSLQTRLKTESLAHQNAEASLKASHDSLENSETKVKGLNEAVKQKDQALAEAATRERSIQDALSRIMKERDEAFKEMDSYSTRFTAEQIADFGKRMKGTQDHLAANEMEKSILLRKVRRLNAMFGMLPDGPCTLPADLRGKVVATDPHWRFVVIDAGEDQGVLERSELLVQRNGKLINKVRVTNVKKGSCIANLEPGWNAGDVVEGDGVIPAYPET